MTSSTDLIMDYYAYRKINYITSVIILYGSDTIISNSYDVMVLGIFEGSMMIIDCGVISLN